MSTAQLHRHIHRRAGRSLFQNPPILNQPALPDLQGAARPQYTQRSPAGNQRHRRPLIAERTNAPACHPPQDEIAPDDYPLIRMVPTRLLPQEVGSTRRQMELLIYFGAPVLEVSGGLEAVYSTLLAMETAIKDLMTLTVVKAARDTGEYLKTQYIETITDEDRLPHYKLFAMRWRVEG